MRIVLKIKHFIYTPPTIFNIEVRYMTDIHFYLRLGFVACFFTVITYYYKKPTTDLETLMIHDFKNKIIKWKRANSDNQNNYVLFLKETFPENIKTHRQKVIYIDPRVMNNWLTYFKECSMSDKLYKTEQLPD